MIDVILTDTHFGWKNNSMTWINSQMQFIYQQFIPKLKELSKFDNVRVIHCGDVFDSRSTISTYVATKVVEAFKKIRENCKEFVIICGNHDFYSPNSDIINSVKLFMSNLDIHIVDREIMRQGENLYVPWFKWIEGNFESDCKYIFTHADLINDSIPDSAIGKTILAGHIHTPTNRNGRYNLGSCYSLNFADSNSERGFYIINEDKISFVPNTVSIKFYRLYNDEILNTNIEKYNTNDYIELYISDANMSSEQYIAAIKKFTERFTHLWIIPQVVAVSDNINEGFTGYNMETIMEEIIPSDLREFYNKVKTKIKSNQ